MKKKIGISFTKTNLKYYWNWFSDEDLGADLELVELSFQKNNTADIYQCDGFVLTGGVDVDPSFYKAPEDYENRPDHFQTNRDLFEEKIYRYSQEKKLPVLGICRGMQLINVLEGGKLLQDLGVGNNKKHKRDQVDKQHSVVINEDSLLFTVTGSLSGKVNSAHHQAIDVHNLGTNLKLNAHNGEEEKIAEGLEFDNKTGKGFMLGVQWHPERMNDREENPLSINLKKEFLNAIRKTGMNKLTIINPSTEEVVAVVNEDTPQSIEHKFVLLQTSQKEWEQVVLSERIAILQRFAGLLEKNIEKLAAVLTSEMGKPLQQSRNEVKGAMARIKWLTENAEKYLGDEWMRTDGGPGEKIVYEPLGVVCNISAWNYPYLVGINVFVPALLAGNSVMYKPSEYATLTGLEIEQLLKLAGVPENVFHVSIGAGDIGEILLDLPFDGYFFTGSYKTGKYIYERVAPKMVPCQCELGGKDPLYVADDIADIKSVAASTADGAFYNNGQSCCAVERIYVHEKIYDQYVDEFIKEVKSWKIGSSEEEGVYIGPVTREEQLVFLRQQVNDALQKGATLLTGGKRIKGKGYFFEPTVLTNVTHDMEMMKEESFGPIIGIMKVKNDAEATALMKDTKYGLTASVYSKDRTRAEQLLKQINAGTAYWNCCDRVSPALPWSGRNYSGFGATLSHAGLRAFTRPKAYHLNG